MSTVNSSIKPLHVVLIIVVFAAIFGLTKIFPDAAADDNNKVAQKVKQTWIKGESKPLDMEGKTTYQQAMEYFRKSMYDLGRKKLMEIKEGEPDYADAQEFIQGSYAQEEHNKKAKEQWDKEHGK